jgi:hypothetical protein
MWACLKVSLNVAVRANQMLFVVTSLKEINYGGPYNGSVAAAGKRILRVCFREIAVDCYRQIRGLSIFPSKTGKFLQS